MVGRTGDAENPNSLQTPVSEHASGERRAALLAARPSALLSVAITRPLGLAALLLVLAIGATRYGGFKAEVDSFLALPTFALFPILLGFRADALLRERLRVQRERIGPVEVVIWWLSGALIFSFAMVLMQALSFNDGVRNLYVVAVTVAIASGLYEFTAPRPVATLRLGHFLRHIDLCLLAALVGGVAVAILVKWETPFPEGEWGHRQSHLVIAPALRIIDNGVLMWANTSHKIGLVSLLAGVSQIHSVTPLALQWSWGFLAYPVYAAGIYLLSLRFLRNRVAALAAVAFGLVILTGHGYFGAGPTRIRTNVMEMILFPLIALGVLFAPVQRRNLTFRRSLTVPLAVGTVLSIVLAGLALPLVAGLTQQGAAPFFYISVAVGAGLALIFARWLHPADRRVYWLLIVALGMFFFLHPFHTPRYFAALLLLFPLGWVVRRQRASIIAIAAVALLQAVVIFVTALPGSNFAEISSLVLDDQTGGLLVGGRFDLVQDTTGLLVVLVFTGSMLLLSFSRLQERRTLVVITAAVGILFFFPDSWFYRAREPWIPLMAAVIAGGLWMLGRNLPRLAIPGVVALGVAAWLGPFDNLKDFYVYEQPGSNSLSVISREEYEIAQFIRDQDVNARVISDFQTMQVVGDLANTVLILDEHMSPKNHSDDGRSRVEYLHDSALGHPSPLVTHGAIVNLIDYAPRRELDFARAAGRTEDQVVFLVVGGKTELWSERLTALGAPPRSPITEPASAEYLARFDDPELYELVWEGDYYRVYRVLDLPEITIGSGDGLPDDTVAAE